MTKVSGPNAKNPNRAYYTCQECLDQRGLPGKFLCFVDSIAQYNQQPDGASGAQKKRKLSVASETVENSSEQETSPGRLFFDKTLREKMLNTNAMQQNMQKQLDQLMEKVDLILIALENQNNDNSNAKFSPTQAHEEMEGESLFDQ